MKQLSWTVEKDRVIGHALIALGVFCAALAPLVRFYAADRLVVAPADMDATITLVDRDATYLNMGTLRLVKGASVASTNVLRGAPADSTGQIAVWDSYTLVEDRTRKYRLDAEAARLAFDRRTARLVDCCGAGIQNDSGVKMSGLGVMWPVGHVARRTYLRFDDTTRRAWPAVYAGEGTVDGLRAYKFTEHVGPVSVGRLDQLAGSFLHLDPKRAYDVDRVYEADLTIWVDPRSGLPVDLWQRVNSRLVTTAGVTAVTVAGLDLRMDDASRRASVARARRSADRIRLIRETVPIGALAAGVVLAGAGEAVLWRGRRARRRRAGPA
jgi:hypothetical protein